ncbi:MAG: hypothetical protein ABL876_03140 [Chitinophagaceae bacterium]
MRYLLLSVVLLTALASCNKPVKGRNGVTYKNAVQYNDYIVGRQAILMKKVLEFGRAADVNLDSAEQMLDKFSDETDEMIVDLKGMPPFKKDSALRDAAVRTFTFYKKVFSTDYKELLQVRNKPGIDVATAEQEVNAITVRLSKEEEGYINGLHKAQRAFADKNHMKLTENKMDKEFEKEFKE